MQKSLTIMCLTWLVCNISGAHAGGVQSIDSIRKAARQFIAEHTKTVYQQPAEINIGKLDSRLRLRQCNLPLDVYLPTGSRDLGRFTLGVRCSGQKPWSLHVPVTVTIYQKVIVTARSLPRGKILTGNDLKFAKHDKSKLPAGYMDELTEGVGMELKRQLSNGAPLTTSMIRKPKIIKRGQRVSIIARAGGMEVRMAGKALAHGAVGDRIRVLNMKSKKKIEGTVTPSGDIRVDI